MYRYTMEIFQAVLNTLVGIIASFLMFWGSIISAIAPQTAVAPAPEEPAITTAEFPTAEEKSAAKPVPVPTQKPAVSPAPPPPQIIPAVPVKPQEQINIETRAALVNILCTPQTGISGISGSGVVIDSRGVILTNAHIGQYFLLRDYITKNNVICTVRIGSPAQERYTATLLYLPSSWIAVNASQLKAAQATGTGENDYALLLITGRTDPNATLPNSFERLEMDRGYVDIGDPVLLAAYPAGFFGVEIVQKSLYASSAIAYVTQLFSFAGDKKIDLFSVGGTVVSQGGSAAGAVARLRNGKLSGIIATASAAVSTGERDLRAVSLSHIDDSLAAAGKGGIVSLLMGDLAAKATDFNIKTAPGLTAQLEAALKGN